MADLDPETILDKFDDLHERIGEFGSLVRLVKHTITSGDETTNIVSTPSFTTLTFPARVFDQPDESLLPSFPGGLQADEKIFVLVSDSFVARLPLDTLERRARQFLADRTGRDRGGVEYAGIVYQIHRFFVKKYLGTIPIEFVVHAKAQLLATQ
jgi:hypothetical protein